MRILIATDAWLPQVNGVVRTLSHVRGELAALGHDIEIFNGGEGRSWALPGYREIRLRFPGRQCVDRIMAGTNPDAVHIATEGPVGMAMRRYCLRHRLPFTTSYHTRFPQYLSSRVPLPGVESATYRWLRRFHGPSRAVLTPAPAITRELQDRGFTNAVSWTRGVDHTLFRPSEAREPRGNRPLRMVYVGRVAVEKGIEDFLRTPVAGEKTVIGDGPARAGLEKRFRDARFTGYLFGHDLVRALGAADVFVFPSRTDTFGLVMLEAMACGLPVAAYPVAGPIDVVEHGVSGWLDEDLGVAIERAATLPREAAIARAAKFSWRETATQFLEALVVSRAQAPSQTPGALHMRTGPPPR